MKLYDSTTSPFCRKVSLVIRKLHLSDQVTSEVVAGTPVAPGTLPLNDNPLGKIPCLIHEGRAYYDSSVICQMLNDLARGDLYGADRYATLTLEALADGILDAAILVVYERRIRPDDLVFEPWLEGQLAKISRGLDALEARWDAVGQGPETVATLAVGCALEYLDFRSIGSDWRAGRPLLNLWYQGIAATPDMQETQPH